MTSVRAGLLAGGAVTLLLIEHEKLSIKGLDGEPLEQLIGRIKGSGTTLPGQTRDGFTAFIDFDRRRFIVRNHCPYPQMGHDLPAEWRLFHANVYVPDPANRAAGVFKLGSIPHHPPAATGAPA